MPREWVRQAGYEFHPLTEGQDGNTDWDQRNRLGALGIGWSKYPTGHVEIATTSEDLFHELIERVGPKTEAAKVLKEFFPHPGFWVPLDRDGCNEAIDRLRLARNSAFRKDA